MGWIVLREQSERRAYAVFPCMKEKKVLLMSTGKEWTLPGGVVQPNELDGDALRRIVFQQLGLRCQVQCRLGEELYDGDTVLVAYLCDVVEEVGHGQYASCYCSYEEIKRGARVELLGRNLSTWTPLRIVGSKEVRRLIYDGCSVLLSPIRRPCETQDCPKDDIYVDEYSFLVRENQDSHDAWRRLAPEDSTGFLRKKPT